MSLGALDREQPGFPEPDDTALPYPWEESHEFFARVNIPAPQ